MKQLLIVDDERGSRESLKAIFQTDYELLLAQNADQATEMLSHSRVDLALLDVMLPGKDGVTLLKEIQAMYPDVPVIMCSASTEVQPVVDAVRTGADDYITKPFDVTAIRLAVKRALERSALRRRVEVLQTEVSREYPIDGIIGESPAFRKALDDARKAAESEATVLIVGESGTGKELVARSIHAWSTRRDDPFVPVHCAALPETLIESELFGHERGAFTSADKQKVGRFDLAGSGTLFFDEVSEMPLTTQVKLLRVLQEREFMRVGGTRVIRTEARIIGATNRDLKELVAEKRFRDDLYYRLSVVPVCLPPLRERPDDIPLLIEYFFNQFAQGLTVQTRGFAPEAVDIMLRYTWPGNIRELRNVIERMLVLHGKNPWIIPEFLPEEFGGGSRAAPVADDGQSLQAAVNEYERALIERALNAAGGVQTRAAKALGTTRRILKYRMEKLNIPANGQPRKAKTSTP